MRTTATCCGCCGGSQSERSAPDEHRRPSPSNDSPVKCDCICGGAIASLANHADSGPIASIQVPAVAGALPGAVVFAIYESNYHPPPVDTFAPSGRMLRTLLMSLVC